MGIAVVAALDWCNLGLIEHNIKEMSATSSRKKEPTRGEAVGTLFVYRLAGGIVASSMLTTLMYGMLGAMNAADPYRLERTSKAAFYGALAAGTVACTGLSLYAAHRGGNYVADKATRRTVPYSTSLKLDGLAIAEVASLLALGILITYPLQ